MTTPSKSSLLPNLAELPRTRASDLKKAGWRGMMLTLRSKGKLVVTNHDEPEAVIISAEEYGAIMKIVHEAEAKTESALDKLRQGFDARLSALQGRSASTRLHSTIRSRAKLGGKVKAGTRY